MRGAVDIMAITDRVPTAARRVFPTSEPSGFVVWVLILFLVLLTLSSFVLPLEDPTAMDALSQLKSPGTPGHLLGTDPLGRDMLSRVIWAARTSLGIAGISVLVAMVFGVMIGLLSGYYGGWLDMLVVRQGQTTVELQVVLPAEDGPTVQTQATTLATAALDGSVMTP